MNDLGVLFDVATPFGGGVGVIAGVVFLLICLAAAYIAFRVLKKSVKMAFRLVIVGIIILIAIAGSVSFWWLGTSKPPRPTPPRTSQSR